MYLEQVSQHDIGTALGLTQARVSQLIAEAWEERKPEREQTVEQAREMTLAKIERFVSHWAKRAKLDPKAADVALNWSTRADRILGLYSDTHRLELAGVNGNANAQPAAFDLSLLTTDELATWEYLMQKAAGTLPPEEPAQEPVIIAKPTPPPVLMIEDQRQPTPVSEYIPREQTPPTLISEILRRQKAGQHIYDIADELRIDRSAVFNALDAHALAMRTQ